MKILIAPHPTLRVVAKPVTHFDKKLAQEISDMSITLKSATDPEGVGLAATQVGIKKRFFILNLKNKIEVIINPEIIAKSEATLADIYRKPKSRWLEGCLSLPHLWGFVNRPYWVDLQYTSFKNGVTSPVIRRFEGVESSYALHEYDHLDGILFTDRILEQGGELLKESPHGLVNFED